MDKLRLMSVMAGKGMTQTKLAALLGMSKNSLCEKINGKRSFKADEIIGICNALGIEDSAKKAKIFLE